MLPCSVISRLKDFKARLKIFKRKTHLELPALHHKTEHGVFAMLMKGLSVNEHVRHFEDAAKEQAFASVQSSRNVAQGVAEMLHESVDFYSQSLQDFMALTSDLFKTRDFRDAWKLHSEYAGKQRSAAMQQYERLAEVHQNMMRTAFLPLQTAHRTAEAAIRD